MRNDLSNLSDSSNSRLSQISKLKVFAQLLLISIGYALLEFSGDAFTNIQQLLADSKQQKEITYFSVYFITRAVISLFSVKLFQKYNIKKSFLIAGSIQLFSRFFCFLTVNVFCHSQYQRNSEQTCSFQIVDTVIAGLCNGMGNGIILVQVGVLYKLMGKRGNIRSPYIVGLAQIIFFTFGFCNLLTSEYVLKDIMDSTRSYFHISIASIGFICYLFIDSQIINDQDVQLQNQSNQENSHLNNHDNNKNYTNNNSALSQDSVVSIRIKQMFKYLYHFEKLRVWAIFSCFSALILGFYSNSIYYFLSAAISNDQQRKNKILQNCYLIEAGLTVFVSLICMFLINRKRYVTVAYLQVILFQLALFICLFNVINCYVKLSETITVVTGISQGIFYMLFYLIGLYAFKGQPEYFAIFSFLYSVCNGFIYVLVQVISLIWNKKFQTNPLLMPRFLLIMIYAVQFLILIAYFFNKKKKNENSSDQRNDSRNQSLLQAEDEYDDFILQSKVKQSNLMTAKNQKKFNDNESITLFSQMDTQSQAWTLSPNNNNLNHFTINNNNDPSQRNKNQFDSIFKLSNNSGDEKQQEQVKETLNYIMTGQEFFQKYTKQGTDEESHLGQGSKGSVYKYFIRENPDTKIAVKITMGASQKDYNILMREVNTIISIQSYENIVKVYNFTILQQVNSFQIFLAMELADCTLVDEIKKRKIKKEYFSSDHMFNFAKQMIETLSQLQIKEDITHRDLKPQNILKCGDIYKLADFGEAKLFTLENITKDPTIRGTVKYLSPEIRKNYELLEDYDNDNDEDLSQQLKSNSLQLWDSFKSDVFSLGLTLIEAATLDSIQQFNSNPQRLENGIQKLKNLNIYSEEFIKLVQKMLTWEPIQRPNFSILKKYLDSNSSSLINYSNNKDSKLK